MAKSPGADQRVESKFAALGRSLGWIGGSERCWMRRQGFKQQPKLADWGYNREARPCGGARCGVQASVDD